MKAYDLHDMLYLIDRLFWYKTENLFKTFFDYLQKLFINRVIKKILTSSYR